MKPKTKTTKKKTTKTPVKIKKQKTLPMKKIIVTSRQIGKSKTHYTVMSELSGLPQDFIKKQTQEEEIINSKFKGKETRPVLSKQALNITIRHLANTYDDVQKIRIQTSNRIDRVKAVYPELKEDEIEVIRRNGDPAKLKEVEQDLAKQMSIYLNDNDVWKEFLSHVKGIGPVYAAKLISYIQDIKRFDNVAKLWSYAGYNVDPKTGTAIKKTKGTQANWHQRLKSLMYNIGGNFIKTDGYYRKKYDEAKLFYQNKAKTQGLTIAPADKIPKKNPEKYISEGHIHNKALRKINKLFLSHLWDQWRKIEKLPTRPPYAIEKLGHTTYYPSEDAKEK